MDDEILIDEVPEIVEDMPDIDIVETVSIEDIPEVVETMPPLYAPLSPPAVGTEVTNGFARDVLGYAEDILKSKPDSEYMLYGNSHLSWILITADHYGSKENSQPCFYGNVAVYHIYQDKYIQNQNYLTWFFDVAYPANDMIVPDDDIENYLVYASPSYGDYPRIMGVYEDAQMRYHVLFGFLLPVVLLWVVLQQVFRRFG